MLKGYLAYLLTASVTNKKNWHLVDELVNDLPKPLIWQVQGDRLFRAQDKVEQVAVVVVRLKPKENEATYFWLAVLKNLLLKNSETLQDTYQ